jgi:hypothetical protein
MYNNLWIMDGPPIYNIPWIIDSGLAEPSIILLIAAPPIYNNLWIVDGPPIYNIPWIIDSSSSDL